MPALLADLPEAGAEAQIPLPVMPVLGHATWHLYRKVVRH
jgi:hypothetical protein